MSRTIGGTPLWGTAKWGVDTWGVTTPVTTLMTRLLQDPSTSAGAPLYTGSTQRLVVELLSPKPASPALWGTALWGVDVWADAVGAWLDISSRVRALDWTIGTEDPGAKSQVGTATVTLNNLDGLVSPWASSGAFTQSGQSYIRAGTIVRFGVIDSSTAVYSPIFTGKIEDTPETVVQNVDSWVDLALVELTADLGGVPTDTSVATGIALTQAIWQVLEEAAWPYGISYTAPDEDALTCSALLQDTSASERVGRICDGLHWDFGADGRGQVLVFQRHQSELDAVATFANKPSATAGSLPMVTAVPYSSVQRVLNTVTGAVVGGVEVTHEDTGSQEQFGEISAGYGFPEDGLVLQDEDAVATLADRVLSLRAWDDQGIASAQLDGDMAPTTLLPALVQLAAYARDQRPYSIVYTHPAGGVLRETVSIEGQHHTVTMEGTQVKWTADLSCGHSGAVSGS